ncbi:MAG: 50S ribosomal protein L25 [Bacillota bacterium]
MTDYLVKAMRREDSGKGANRQLRRAGKVPAVLYGNEDVHERLVIETGDFERLLKQGALGKLVNVEYKAGRSKKTVPALLKEVQTEPINGRVIHADFQAVDMKQEIATIVPVHYVGEDRRVNDGSVVQPLLREVHVTCLPDRIPAFFEVDVSGLRAGESITVGALKPEEGVTIHTPAEEALVAAVHTRQGAEAEAAEGTEEAEAEGATAEAGGEAK